ncbi:MAG: hypothetical protein JWN70_6102 [Planctomycetaceae bacterium]|nr:hypothetical protein [Planctomycetaceae bacterium]
MEKRLRLLVRESLRRNRDRTLRTRILSFLDTLLGLGYWLFPAFEYECHNPDGSLWSRNRVRHSLAGYTISWGYYVEYYDGGLKAYEGEMWQMPRKTILRKHKYWRPDGTQVSQTEWMRENLGPEIDGCHDLAWEK